MSEFPLLCVLRRQSRLYAFYAGNHTEFLVETTASRCTPPSHAASPRRTERIDHAGNLARNPSPLFLAIRSRYSVDLRLDQCPEEPPEPFVRASSSARIGRESWQRRRRGSQSGRVQGAFSGETQRGLTPKTCGYRPSASAIMRCGFPARAIRTWRTVRPAGPDCRTGRRRNGALVNSKFWTTKFLDRHSLAAVRVLSC